MHGETTFTTENPREMPNRQPQQSRSLIKKSNYKSASQLSPAIFLRAMMPAGERKKKGGENLGSWEVPYVGD
jgi:hypothetical protein